MKRSAAASLLVALAACGGNVILDASPGSGGHGGGAGIGGAGVGGAVGTGGAVGIGGSTMFTAVGSSAGGATGAGAGNPCGALHLYADPTCEGCAQTSCCGELAACDVGTQCFALAGCLSDCPQGNPGCQNGCLGQFSSGSPAFQALANCFNTACGTLPECGSPSPNVCDSTLPPATSSACASCLTVGCCSSAEQCGQSGSCQKCFAVQAPMGCDPTYDQLLSCEQAACSNVCP